MQAKETARQRAEVIMQVRSGKLTVKAAAGTQIQRIKNRTAQVLLELR